MRAIYGERLTVVQPRRSRLMRTPLRRDFFRVTLSDSAISYPMARVRVALDCSPLQRLWRSYSMDFAATALFCAATARCPCPLARGLV